MERASYSDAPRVLTSIQHPKHCGGTRGMKTQDPGQLPKEPERN